MLADSGDTGLGKTYGQYVTLDEPVPRPRRGAGVAATAKPGAIDVTWNAAERATRYYVTAKDAARRARARLAAVRHRDEHDVRGPAGRRRSTRSTCARRTWPRARRAATTVKATPTQGARVADHDDAASSSARRSRGETTKLIADGLGPEREGHDPLLQRRRDLHGRDRPSRPTTAATPGARSRWSTARPRSTHRRALARPAQPAGEVHDRQRGELPLVGLGARADVPRVEAARAVGRDRVASRAIASSAAGSRSRSSSRLHAGRAVPADEQRSTFGTRANGASATGTRDRR